MVKFYFLFTLLPEQSKAIGRAGARAGARAVNLPARSYDLAGVALPVLENHNNAVQ